MQRVTALLRRSRTSRGIDWLPQLSAPLPSALCVVLAPSEVYWTVTDEWLHWSNGLVRFGALGERLRYATGSVGGSFAFRGSSGKRPGRRGTSFLLFFFSDAFVSPSADCAFLFSLGCIIGHL
jgi:hypothetical protein